jgi:ATP-dependent helicase/DNAse subunit B
MSSSLLIAPAGRGKTHYAIQRIREVLTSQPLAPVTVILPNQVRVAEFRRRLAAAGGALGVNLLTFRSLYADLLARAGQPKPRLLDPVQVRLLRAIVDRLWRQGELHHYGSLRTKPGFVVALRDFIQELKRARVDPVKFSTDVKAFGARLRELAAIYQAYQDWLLEEDWVDPEGQGWLAAIALDENPKLGSEIRLLVVNGFDEFNPTQLGVLAHLARRAAETLITLTGDLERTRLAHRRFQRAQRALTERLSLQVQPLAPPRHHDPSSALAYLEANLFEGRSPSPPNQQSALTNQGSVEFLEAQTRSEEVRAALRWVKARIVRDGLGLDQVAVLARNLDPYRPFLEETAAEFGMPLRVIGGMPLAQNPAVAAILSLLSLPALDWPRRQVLEAWRSPYFDWSAQGIESGDAARLEAASRQGRVVSGLSQWQQAFDLLASQKPMDEALLDEEEIGLVGAGPVGAGLRPAHSDPALPHPTPTLHQKFDAFVAHLTPPLHGTMRTHIAFVESLIGPDPASPKPTLATEESDSLSVVSRARANPSTQDRDLAALLGLKDVLRGLALAEATLGSAALDYPAFFDELRGAVEAAGYMNVPESGVLVASVSEARSLSFQAVALLGLSEGEFPQAEREDLFLRESDRMELQDRGLRLESRLRGDEVSFFYQAVTRARQRLLLTRPYLADDGQGWESSPYWLQASRLLGGSQPRRVRPEDPLLLEEAASKTEFIQAGGRLVQGTAELSGPHLARGAAILRARLDRTASGSFEGQLPELAGPLSRRYAASHGWSPSRLEAYGTCSFYFYIAHALELQPRTPPEEGFDVRILGSMLHKILEEVFRRVTHPNDLDECLDLLTEVAHEVFASAPDDYGFRPTALWSLQQDELQRMLRETITALVQLSTDFIPVYFEERFGMGKPALLLQTESGEVRLHGYIDRVDRGSDGRLRVIDYKAGGSPISPRHLEEGRRLQLPLYALAARDALGLGPVSAGFYWHIGRAEASSLKLEKYQGGIDAAIAQVVQHVAAYVKDIRAGQFQPKPPSDGCPSYCPAAAFCWRYKSKRG